MNRALEILRSIPTSDLIIATVAAISLWFTAAILAAIIP